MRNTFLILGGLFLFVLNTNGQPGFTKVFSPSTIGPGSSTTLTFTIDNTGGGVLNMLDFTDNFPAGMTVAAVPNAAHTCADGTLTAVAGDGTITFSDGRLAAGGTCTITVNVTSSTVGTHTNLTGDLTSSAGNSGTATDDLTVSSTLPGFSKSFSPNTVDLGEISTLTFTIDNTLNPSNIATLNFTDNLPAGLVVANPSNASTNCFGPGGGTLTADSGTSTISLNASGANFNNLHSLSAGSSCTVTVDVDPSVVAGYENISGSLTADWQDSGFSTDKLITTVDPIHIQKSFTNDPTTPGQTVDLEFTINNYNRDFQATGVTFTDDLNAALAGLTFSTLNSNSCGGSVMGVGTTTVSLSGGTIAAQGACTINITCTVPGAATPGTYTNTTGTVSGTVDGSMINGNEASNDLVVSPAPILTKTFTNDPVVPGGTVDLEFTITNTSTTHSLISASFTDELTTFLPFPVNAVLPSDPCGAGSSISLIIPNTDVHALQLSNGTVAAGSSCTFTVTINIPSDQAGGTYTNTTSNITGTVNGNAVTGSPATDDLVVLSAPQITKTFLSSPNPGDTVDLEFSIEISGNAPTDATNIAFMDDLTAMGLTGLVVESGGTQSDICGTGSSLSVNGTNDVLTFSNGTLSAGTNCTFKVTLRLPNNAAPATFTNTTSNVTATVSSTAVTGNQATADLLVGVINFTKEFLTDPVIPGGTSKLKFTIAVDANSPTDATSIQFTDNVSTMLSGATFVAPPADGSCGASSTFVHAGGFLQMSGGSVSIGSSCTFEVDVNIPTGAATGNYTNRTISNSAVVNGNPILISAAIDDLTVNGEIIQLSKTFPSSPIPFGTASTNLDFTITNLDATNTIDNIAFTDDLNAFITGATMGTTISNTCGGTISGDGTGMMSASGISLTGGSSCTFTISINNLGAVNSNTYTNTTSTATGDVGGLAVTGPAASNNLVVTGAVVFTKAFGGTTAAGATTTLDFTITNNENFALNDIDFTDDLNAVIAGMTVVGALPTDPCGTGSTLTGTSTLVLDAGTLAANGGSCTFQVTVMVPCTATANTYVNTTSELRVSSIPIVGLTANADITVTGSLPPMITTCPPTRNVEGCGTSDIMNGGLTALAYSETEVTITEGEFTTEGGVFTGSPVVIKYQDSSSGTCPIVVTRTYTITNDCGTTSCMQTINIDDTTKPSITGTLMTLNEEGCSASNASTAYTTVAELESAGVMISDVCTTDANLTVSHSDASSGTCPVVVTRTYTVKDACGNGTDVTQTINVDDTTDPVISTCPPTRDVEGCDTGDIMNGSLTALAYSETDVTITNTQFTNEGGAITEACGYTIKYKDSSTGTCPIVITRTFTVTDDCGNPITCDQTINIDDDTAPSITGTLMTLNEEGCSAGEASAAYTTVAELEAAGVMISDICTSDANLVVTYSDASTGTCPIVVTRTYTVKDACGNGTDATQTINVDDTTVPTPLCQPVTVELNSSGLASLSATQVDNGSSDLCSGVSLSIDITSFDCDDLGDHTVTLTVTDDCNNVNTCTAIVTVEDNIAPVVTCKDATIQLDATGNVILSPFKVYNSTSDNCAIATLSVSPNTFDCMDIGTHTVTLTATDYGGNPATCTATVTVEDTMAPIAKCKDHTVQLNSSGVGMVTASDVDDGSSDNCGIASSSINLSSFNCDDVGPHMATLSLTDVNGNNSSCTATVTVVDDIDPEAKCKDITITCPGGIVTIDPSEVDNGSSDNCSFSLSLNQTILPCSSTPVTVTLTATDASGNVDDCTSLVTFNVQTGTTTLSINNVSKLEGNWFGFTFYQFEVERTGGVGATSVDYATADGTAEVANNDYIPATGTLNWTSGGSNFQYFTVLVRKDNFPEMDEIFYVNLSNPTGGAVIGDGQGEGEILDDDTPSPSPLVDNNDDDELAQSHVQISKYRPTLFPNPTQEELFISLPNSWLEDSQNVKAELYDNSGRMMRSFDLSQQESKIEVYDLRNGMYHLVFFPKNGEIISERFVKMD
ncbi:T9SS type A sorting domain-containing protein [Saprospiraceae bacterium]|nr:T9SS type A sorting domain-containing protein [Bacteroidota bacterium]MDB4727702.1 T9SS type A sorting domain-containing protein [Saprospiraceae bacterium]